MVQITKILSANSNKSNAAIKKKNQKKCAAFSNESVGASI
ncbi:hypothetical protein D1BOALGB6SA_6246 [Olavius sp. associated proteobacterium Delta 1]|nr:hypothetical protein D1BOALGB6SA_6246 [Olavius sp. associated proteobacterium Delta 1]